MPTDQERVAGRAAVSTGASSENDRAIGAGVSAGGATVGSRSRKRGTTGLVADESVDRADGGALVTPVNATGRAGSRPASHDGETGARVITPTRTSAFGWANAGIRIDEIAPSVVATTGLASKTVAPAGATGRQDVARASGMADELAAVSQALANPVHPRQIVETLAPEGVPGVEEGLDR